MSKHIGIIVGPQSVELVRLEKITVDSFTLEDFKTIKVPVAGERYSRCKTIYDQVLGFLTSAESKGASVTIKSSAVPLHKCTDAILLGAEIRGVVQLAAAQSTLPVSMKSGASISRIEKGKKCEDYCKDDDYWATRGLSEMKKGAREAALFVTTDR